MDTNPNQPTKAMEQGETPAPQPNSFNIKNGEDAASKLFDMIKSFTTFASLMRVAGGLLVLAAMAAFVMKGWSEGNDISRYMMLLSQTFILAVAGLALSYVVRENKGARVFFGLGLVSITVNMVTLGALIFSTTQWGSSLVAYPDFAKWQAADFASITVSLIATLIISLPIAWFSYKIFARNSAKLLVGLSLFSNLLLLVPVRESGLVAILAIVAFLVPIIMLRKAFNEDKTLRTTEGFFSIVTVFLPAIIIVLRSLWLYPINEVMQIAIAGTAFIALRVVSANFDRKSQANDIAIFFSAALAYSIASSLFSIAYDFHYAMIHWNVFGIAAALLLVDIASRYKSKVGFCTLAAIVLSACSIIPAVLNNAMISPILCILAGIAIIYIGRYASHKTITYLGGITIIGGVAQHIYDLFSFIDFSNWITLAITGSIIIIAASLFERHGAVLKIKWDNYMAKKNN